MLKFLTRIGLALLLSLVIGLVIGTVLRARLERPVVYLGHNTPETRRERPVVYLEHHAPETPGLLLDG